MAETLEIVQGEKKLLLSRMAGCRGPIARTWTGPSVHFARSREGFPVAGGA
jgi:hypothetical protein